MNRQPGIVISIPDIISRDQHNISRKQISRAALNVLYGLKDAGYESLLVGGGVRDLLLGLQPKDFDIATSASPDEVKEVFGRRCRLIGRRFRLAHVRFGGEIIEVSTFRAQTSNGGNDGAGDTSESDATEDDDVDHEIDDSGRILRDNVYGNREEDAFRRDFTVNALYYNIEDFSVVDYVEGMADLEARQMRFIGDPVQRYREDPVRMLRAIRLASKLDFSIEQNTERPIAELGPLLADVPPARLFEEILKMLMTDHARQCFEGLREYGLFQQLFPQTQAMLDSDDADADLELITQALENTETRIREDKPVTPFFLLGVLLWPAVRQRWQALQVKEMPLFPALNMAGGEVVEKQISRVAIPRRFSTPMREMWQMQPRFERRRGKAPMRLLGHPRFRAAYDFLLLRAQAGEVEQELVDWWTEFQVTHESERQAMTASAPGASKGRRRPHRRRRSSNKGNQSQ